MIQDLDGKVLDNQYYDKKPADQDFVMAISQGKLYMKEQDGYITYPRYSEVKEKFAQKEFRYLFAIDDEAFFLTEEVDVLKDLERAGYVTKEIRWMRGERPRHLSYAGTLALQLAGWYDTRRFCGRCGAPVVHSKTERAVKCPECGVTEYPKICPCVIVGVIHDGKILVSQYRGGFTNHYALIAGFAEFGETIEECVKREVLEETNLEVCNLKYYNSQPWPFSSSLLFGFFCELKGEDHIVIQEDELAMAKWVTPEEIYEEFRDDALTNEMLCLFKKYGEDILTMDEYPDIREESLR